MQFSGIFEVSNSHVSQKHPPEDGIHVELSPNGHCLVTGQYASPQSHGQLLNVSALEQILSPQYPLELTVYDSVVLITSHSETAAEITISLFPDAAPSLITCSLANSPLESVVVDVLVVSF